ncbi:ECT2 protein, partial [Polyodon spathula]|nr:ECT2 protein [Polyodon spathula]
MEVPVVRIKGGEPGSESGNKFIKTIVNMEIKVPCIKTCNVEEFGDGENTEFETIFILADFGCPEYGYLYKKDNRILGPPVVLHCAAKEEPLPFSSRPLYCTTMLNLVLCFTGFRKKEEVVNCMNYWKLYILSSLSNVAVSMGTPILKTEWIYKAWEKRNEPNFCAAAEEFRLEYKVPPFQDCVLSFLGFSDEDKASMEDMTEMQGMGYSILQKVIEFSTLMSCFLKFHIGAAFCISVEKINFRLPIVNRWFCRFVTRMNLFSDSEVPSFLFSCLTGRILPFSAPLHSGMISAIFIVIMDPCLLTIIGVLKLLTSTVCVCVHIYIYIYIYIINFQDETLLPVVQSKMLCRSHSKELVKAYPPFVNFFEMSKETISKCEKQKPRFHAFLKINQAKPECGRQTLTELLIRPVQRLPSVALLLTDIRKHTTEDNPDKVTLEKAIESLKEVMTHINEDKRKTEGQKQIFDVVYEVDNCPANLLSSHRSLVHRVETISLGDKPCDRGENVTLFLFNDCLEIARKRHKVISTFRSPHGGTRPQASLKHITLMPLSQIRKVLDLKETEDCHNAFALVVRPPTEQDNLLLSFQLTAEDTLKEDWLRMLCRHVANTICKADAVSCCVSVCDFSDETALDTQLCKSLRVIVGFRVTSEPVSCLPGCSVWEGDLIWVVSGCTPDSPTSGTGNYLGGRLASTSSLAISRSTSTFSLNCSARHANVHRSNSLDASSPSSRLRAPICTEPPSSPISNNRVSTSCTSNTSPTAQISSVPTITTAFEQSPQSVSPPQRSSLVTRRETLL